MRRNFELRPDIKLLLEMMESARDAEENADETQTCPTFKRVYVSNAASPLGITPSSASQFIVADICNTTGVSCTGVQVNRKRTNATCEQERREYKVYTKNSLGEESVDWIPLANGCACRVG